VSRDKVCEAGFVVRRRRLSFAAAHAPQAAALVKQIGELSGQIARIDRGGGRVLKKRVQVTGGGVFGMAAAPATASTVDARYAARRAELAAQLEAARTQLAQWKVDSGAVSVAEGWIADPTSDNVGAWQAVDETPRAVEETIYPLTPLVPDPRQATHDAAGKTLWFGVVPGGSREVDAAGNPRYDDETKYEIRCFVRRHCCHLPKTGQRNDCPGELVWSAPTEAWQLAAFFDPTGTGNHPINIKMPDIPALAATVGSRLPVAMQFPKGSALNVSADKDLKPQNKGTNAGFQICFFSIPLITIVATFVLNLFLPIVVFLFGLWFLLGLKFCIPPSFSLAGGLGLDLSLKGSLGVQIDAALGGSISLDADVLAGLIGTDLNASLTGSFDAIEVPGGSGHWVPIADTVGDRMTKGGGAAGLPAYSNQALGQLDRVVGRSHENEPHPNTPPAPAWVPGPLEPRVERWEVGA
jgi:hypothetical protein